MTRARRAGRLVAVTVAVIVVMVSAPMINKILGGVVDALVLIGVCAAYAMNRPMATIPATRRFAIPAYGGLCALIVVGTGVVVWVVERGDYSACLDRVERSEANHAQWEKLFDTFDSALHTPKYTTTALIPGDPLSLRQSLKPALTVGECRKYQP